MRAPRRSSRRISRVSCVSAHNRPAAPREAAVATPDPTLATRIHLALIDKSLEAVKTLGALQPQDESVTRWHAPLRAPRASARVQLLLARRPSPNRRTSSCRMKGSRASPVAKRPSRTRAGRGPVFPTPDAGPEPHAQVDRPTLGTQPTPPEAMSLSFGTPLGNKARR
jgi:hypothetical protein